jgi:hypothetical protein
MEDIVTNLHERLRGFGNEARKLLAKHETSRDRVMTLGETKAKLLGGVAPI